MPAHANVRFAVAVHILVLLALEPEPQVSARIAGSVATHPVVVRRLLGLLQRAGLVTGRSGPAGGFRLARPATTVTLADIYRAVETDGAAPPRHRPNRRCPVGRHVTSVLDDVRAEAAHAFVASLERRTLAHAALEVKRAVASEA